MGITRSRATIGATIALTAWSGPISAQTASTAIVPFSEFVNSLSIAPADTYVGRSGAAVKSTAAFEEMRQHLVSMYSGVEVKHSFIQGNQVFDCVPIHDQPGMRMQPSKTVPEPPPSPPRGVFRQGQNSDSPQVHETQGTLGEPDPLGDAQQCQEGTIPMRRLTLEELTRFETLQDYFSKDPQAGGHRPQESEH
jgi:hypothetical protein